MKSHFFAPLLISSFSIALTSSLLIHNDDACISVIAVSFLLFSLSIFISFRNFVFLNLYFILFNHFAFIEGISLIRYSILGISLLLIPFLILEFKPQNKLSLIASIISVPLYYLVIFSIRPYNINLAWVFIHAESFLFFIFVQIFKWDLKSIIKLTSLHLGFFLIYGLFEYFLSDASRIRGPMKSATGYGALLVVIWSIWFSYNIFKKERNLFFTILITLFTFTIILWTGTRMALIGILVTSISVSFVFIFHSKSSLFVKLSTLILTPVFLYVFFILVWQFVPDDLMVKKSFESLLSGQIDMSNMGRILGWIGAWNAFLSNPIFGIGNGNFLAFLQEFTLSSGIDFSSLGINLVPHAHNLYLILLSENGLFGFSVVLIIFLLAINNYFKYLRNTKCIEGYSILVGLIVLCTLCLFDSMPFYPPTEAWGAWLLGSLLQISSKSVTVNSETLIPFDISNSNTRTAQEFL